MKFITALVSAVALYALGVSAEGDSNRKLSWIGNDVYHDANGNGIRDKNEKGFKKVTLALYEGTTMVGTTLTSYTGKYYFDNLPAGEYTVEVTDDHDMLCGGAELISKPSQPTPLSGSDENDDVDFGYKCPATPRPTPRPTCEHPTPQPTPRPQKQPTPESCIGDTVYITNSAGDCNPSKGKGVGGVEVCLYEGDDKVDCKKTDKDGHYKFCGLGAGSYTVKVDEDDVDAEGCDGASASLKCKPDQPTDLDGSNKNLDVDFGYTCPKKLAIGDTVWEDTNGNGKQDPGEPGIPGIKLELYKGDKKIGTETTNKNGKYLFTGLDSGKYTVVVTNPPKGWALTGSPKQPIVLKDKSDLDVDFGYQPPCCPPAIPGKKGKMGSPSPGKKGKMGSPSPGKKGKMGGKRGRDLRFLAGGGGPDKCVPCPCCRRVLANGGGKSGGRCVPC